MAGKIIKGSDFRIKIFHEEAEAPTAVYHATNCDAEFNTEFDEIVTKDTDGGVEVTPTQITWGLSGESLMVDDSVPGNTHNFKSLYKVWRERKRVNVEMTVGGEYEGAFKITGQAYIESLSDGAPAEGNATVSYSLKCVGNPTMTDIDGGPLEEGD